MTLKLYNKVDNSINGVITKINCFISPNQKHSSNVTYFLIHPFRIYYV